MSKLEKHDDWNKTGGPLYPKDKVVQFCFRNFPTDQRQGLRALDLGCGGGVHTAFLARHGFSVTAVDFSPNSVEITRQKLRDEGLSGEVIQQSVDAIEMDPGSIDLLLCIEVFQCVDASTAASAVERIQAVLKPGGRGLFLFASDADTLHRSSPLDLRGYTEKEVRLLFEHKFSEVFFDRSISTYRDGDGAPGRMADHFAKINMTVLAISVHPDDETLGCAGTLLKHGAAGDTIHWLIVSRALAPQWPDSLKAAKAAEIAAVAQAFGVAYWKQCDFPAAHLDTVATNDLIHEINDFMSSIKPEVVYLVHGGDVNSDHAAVFEAVMAVVKPFHLKRLGVRKVLCYETLSSTEAAPALAHRAFLPTVFSDITPWIDRKIEIMALYASETQPEPLPRSASAIRALARWRGATVGCEYAEAFMPIRELF